MSRDGDDHAKLSAKLDDVLEQQRALIARLQEGQDYFRHLARSVWRVQEDERRRLAYALHDGIGHDLTALIHLVTQASQAIDARPGEARERLDRACEVAQSTLKETREMSRLLRPQILDDLGLEAALRWLARSFGENHGVEVTLDVAGSLADVGGDLSTLVFRVAQEALSNAAKHAGAGAVAISVGIRGGFLDVAVRDDGRGADPAAALGSAGLGRSTGLGGLRDRARLFGGALRVESKPGAGFAITAQFPLRDIAGKPP